MTSLLVLSFLATLIFLITFAYYLDSWERSRDQAWYTNDSIRTLELACVTGIIALIDTILIALAIFLNI